MSKAIFLAAKRYATATGINAPSHERGVAKEAPVNSNRGTKKNAATTLMSNSIIPAMVGMAV